MKVKTFFWAALLAVGCLHAQTYVITSAPKEDKKYPSAHEEKHDAQKQKKHQKNSFVFKRQIGFGGFYAKESYSRFSFVNDLNEDLYSPGKIETSKVHPSLLFNYRYHKFMSFGLHYQRTHSSAYDLKVTLKPANLNSVGNGVSTLEKFYSHNHNFFLYVRHHLMPSHSLDPFIELGLGNSHQIGGIIDSSGAHYRTKWTNPMINSLGFGGVYKLGSPISLEGTLIYRNQKSVKLQMPGAATGEAGAYRSIDARFMVIYGW